MCAAIKTGLLFTFYLHMESIIFYRKCFNYFVKIVRVLGGSLDKMNFKMKNL